MDYRTHMVFFDNGEVWRVMSSRPLRHVEIEARVRRAIRYLSCDDCIVEVVRERTQPQVVNIIGLRVLEDEDEILPRPKAGNGMLRWRRRHASKTRPSLPEVAD